MSGRIASPKLGWPRVFGLLLATAFLSSGSWALYVVIPLSLLALFRPPQRRFAALAVVFFGLFVVVGVPSTGLWYVERGWALILGGWFLALTLRWPEGTFISRGLGAVGGAFAAMALLFWSRPGQWAVVDWALTARLEEGLALAVQTARMTMGPEAFSLDLEGRLLEFFGLYGMIFPALLGLASLSALGLAWWLYMRLSRASEIGIGPLVDFRFNDQLVWILIAGFVLLLASSGALARMGTNTVVFMGALYALRGVAVLLVILGGPTLTLNMIFVVLFVVAAPFFVTGAFVFGLGDTWLNLRVRWGREPTGLGPNGSS